MLKVSRTSRAVGWVTLAAIMITSPLSEAQTDGEERLVLRTDSAQIGLTSKTPLRALDKDLVPELEIAGPELVGDREISIRYFARAAGVGLPAGSGLTGKGKVKLTFNCIAAGGTQNLAKRTVKFDARGNAAVQLSVTPSSPCERVRVVRNFKGALAVEAGGTLAERFSVTPLDPLAARTANSCEPAADTLCLQGGRFQVQTTWKDFSGPQRPAFGMPGANDAGDFYFFSQDNWEVLIKVLDGCEINNQFWVFAGGLTNVEMQITVTDTLHGTTRQYANPLGTPFQPVQDTAAFATCP